MRTYRITAPDGKEYSIEGPEGATREQVIAKIQERLAAQPQQAETPRQTAPTVGQKNSALMRAIKNSPVGGFIKGLRDIPEGGAQLLTRGLEAIAPAGSDFERFMRSERERVEQINQNAEQDYRQNWRQGQDPGLDLGRIGGNIAATLPLAAPFAISGAASMPARIAAGAGAGATSAALMPVSGERFADEKLQNTLIGGVTGAASPFIADAIGKLTQKIAARVKPQNIDLQGELAKRGVDYSKLSDELKQSLADDAAKALRAGQTLDADALARKADFEALGIKPTLGQLTSDPMQYAFERNTRGIAGAGEELSQRFREQNQGLLDAVKKTRSGIGGTGIDQYNAGQAALEALKNADDAARNRVTGLYETARNAAGINTSLNPGRFAQQLNNTLDDAMLGDALPGGVRKAINQIATGEMPFTIQKAEQIRQAINGQMPKIPGRESVALKMVNDALQNEIDLVGLQAGQQAGGAFKAARGAAAQRFAALDESPALKAATEGFEPNDFINKFVIRAKPGDLMALRSNLQRQPELWNELRGQVIDFLKNSATGGQLDEFAKFSQSGFKNGLKSIGDARLKILFSPDEIAELRKIQRVAAAIQVQPEGSAVNNSGTSQAVANLLNRLSGVPYLRELAINPLMNFRMQGQVNSALNPGNFAGKTPAAIPGAVNPFALPLAISGYPLMRPLTQD